MRHLIDPADFTLEETLSLMDLADRIHEDPAAYLDVAARKRLATLFYEPSTRTRLSFEAAMLNLGGQVLGFPDAGVSSASKGETVADTIRVISCVADIAAMRHPKEGAPLRASRYSRIPVINAGDGAHAHPSQGLLNLFTIEQHKGHLEGLKVAILGDVLHSRVARSDIYGMRKMGMEVHIAGPKTLLPRFLSEEPGIVVHERIEDAIKDADVIEVLRIQLERMKGGLFPTTREYARIFGLNNERLALAKDDVLVLHPGPMNKGWEISPFVAYGDNSAIQEEVQNGVAVRMALFTLVLTGGKQE